MKRTLFGITTLAVFSLGALFAVDRTVEGPIAPRFSEAEAGTFLAPEVLAPPQAVPMGTEIPVDSLRRLKAKSMPSPTQEHGDTPSPSPLRTPIIRDSFATLGFTGWIPPDPDVAVGHSDLVVVVNPRIAFYDRDGNQIYNNTLSNFFSPLNPPSFIFDPRVIYDLEDHRFVVVALAMNSSTQESYFLLAVSTDSTAQGTWAFWKINANVNNTWADFPGIGYNSDAVFLSANQFTYSGSFQTAQVISIKKSELYGTYAITIYRFTNLQNSDGTLAFTVKPAQSPWGASSEYLLNTKSYGWNKVTLWRIDNAGSSPSLTRQATISVASYSPPPNAEQQGDTSHLDTGDSRISGPVTYRSGYVYTSFAERAYWSGDGYRSAVRWLKIDVSSNSADIDYSTWGASFLDYYYPALTVDQWGNMALVCTRSGPSEYAGIRYTGWRSDRTSPETSAWLHPGEGPYDLRDGQHRNRWGDYFDAVPDPLEPYLLWIFGEYATNNNQWQTFIGAVITDANLVASTSLTGWDFPIVPRDTNDASFFNAHLTAELPGNTTGTYLNLNFKNEGPGAAPSHQGLIYFDDEPFIGYSINTMPPGIYGILLNWGPYLLRGGRHTISDSLDTSHSVPETNENDNFYERQFVWSPLEIAADEPIERTAPPKPGNGPYPNSDGFLFVKPSSYAGVVALTPLETGDDYDLYLYTDYVGSDSGFSVLANTSLYSSGMTDYVVFSWNVAEDTTYPAAVRYSGSSLSSFILEADNSVGNLLSASGGTRTDTLAPNEILELYECYLYADSTYRFSLENISGGTAIMYLYPDTAAFYRRSQYIAWGSGSYDFLYIPGQSGWYPLVVVKSSTTQLPNQISYTLRVERLSAGTWLGLVSSDWHTDTNWVGNAVPSTATNVLIPAWASYMPVISNNTAYCQNLQILNGASLEITNNQNLIVHGTVTNNGTLTGPDANHFISVYGDFYNNGTWSSSPSSYLTFTGGGTHELSSGDSLSNLTILAGNEVYLTGTDLALRGALYLYGTFNARSSSFSVSMAGAHIYENGSYVGDSLHSFINFLQVDSGGVFTLRNNFAVAEIGTQGSDFLLEGTFEVGDTFAPSILVSGDLFVGPYGKLIPGHSTLHFVGSWNQTVTDTFHTTVTSPGAYNVVINKPAGQVTVDAHALIIGNNLSIYNGTLFFKAGTDTIRGDVTLYGGTLDLEDDFYCQVFVGGDWDDRSGVFQETSSTDWQTSWVVFYGPQVHHVWQGSSNSFSGVEFHDSTTYLETDVNAYWYFNLSKATLNTQGHDVTIQRAFQIWDSPGTLIQTGGTLTARGMSLSGGIFQLTGGSFYLTLDDPYVSNWWDVGATFQPSTGHTTVFYDTTDILITQASTNHFGNLIIDKGSSTIWARLKPLPPSSFTPSRRGNPTTIEGSNRTVSSHPSPATPMSPPRTSGVTLDSDVTVTGALSVQEGSTLNLNGYTLTVLSLAHADGALVLAGTLHLQNPGDSLLVPVADRDVVVTPTGELKLSNGYVRINDELNVYGTFLMSGGVYQSDTTNGYGSVVFQNGSFVQISGGLLEINSTWAADGTANWQVTGGIVHFYGNGPSSILNYSPTLILNHLVVGDDLHSKPLEVLNYSGAPFYILGNFQIHVNDSVFLPDHQVLECLGDSMRVDGYLNLGSAGSVLRLGGGTKARFRNGGTLVAIGAPSAPDTVTHAGNGYYEMTFYSGSHLSAEYTVFEYMNVGGIRFFGATLDPAHPLSRCTFRNSYAGGRLLLLNVPQVITIEDAHFPENTWSGYVNVARTSATGQVTFVDATGPFAGEAHEYDPYNTIFWETSFLPGDANNDGMVNDLDLVYLANYLYHGGPAPAHYYAGDNDHDCSVTKADLEYLANYLYHNGPAPSPCGTAPAAAQPVHPRLNPAKNTGNLQDK